MSKVNLKSKMKIELTADEIATILEEYVAKELGRHADEVSVVLRVKQVQAGMQWDQYTTNTVEASVHLT